MAAFEASKEGKLSFCLLLCPQEKELQGELTHAPNTTGSTQEEKKVESCSAKKISSTEERMSVGGAIERLGLELLEKLPTSRQQPNVILSPISVALALAQLTLGQYIWTSCRSSSGVKEESVNQKNS